MADNWTGPHLFERMEVQLGGDYLRDVRSSRGIFLLVYIGAKGSWDLPNGGKAHIAQYDAAAFWRPAWKAGRTVGVKKRLKQRQKRFENARLRAERGRGSLHPQLRARKSDLQPRLAAGWTGIGLTEAIGMTNVELPTGSTQLRSRSIRFPQHSWRIEGQRRGFVQRLQGAENFVIGDGAFRSRIVAQDGHGSTAN